MSLPLYIARRYFSSKKGYLFVSFLNLVAVCGVALGVFAMVVVLSSMTGFSKDLQQKLLGFNSHIRIFDQAGSDTSMKEFEKKVEDLIGGGKIADLQKCVEGEVIIQREGETSESALGAKVRGMDLTNLSKMSTVEFLFSEGGADGNLPGIILGDELLMLLGAQPEFHDILRLTAPFGGISPIGNVIPNVRVFQLTGGFRSGYYTYDSKYALMSYEDARRLLGAQARSGFFVWLKKPGEADNAAGILKNGLGDKYEIKSWSDENKKLFRALKLERVGMTLLLILIIIIASFSVVSVVLMLVFSKQKDIGMLQALGLSRGRVLKIFIYKGLMIGILGTIIGIILGLTACFALSNYRIPLPESYYLDYLPVEVQAWQILLIGAVGVVIALAASIYPARQAMNVNTTAVLRYE